MSFKYVAGDKLQSKTGRTAVIHGTRVRTRHGGHSSPAEEYQLVPDSGPYAGKTIFKDKILCEDPLRFTLIGGPSFTPNHPLMSMIGQVASLDVDETILKYKVQVVVPSATVCDCGAHKCGYKDDELHGHARWCKTNERIAITIR